MNPIPHASISFVFIDEWTLNTSEERKNEWINEWNNCSHTHTINIHLLFCLNACMQSIYQYFACSINTNARQICATIDFMCFNWLNVCRRRFLSLFLLLSFCLYCVRLFISCVFETALFVFFSSFLFDFQLFFVLERRLNSTRLYLLANVYAMIVLFVFSSLLLFSLPALRICTGDLVGQTQKWRLVFFSFSTFQPWNINRKIYSGVV